MDAEESECERLLADGRPEAVSALLRRFQRPLYSFLVHLVGDRLEAEDILQEVMVRVWEARGRYEARGRLAAWLFTIARRAALDRLRGRARAVPLEEGALELPAPEAEGPERGAAALLTRASIADALAGLPDAQREVFLMREYGGLSFAEVAAATQAPLGTVLARMRYAVLKLRRVLGDLDA